MNDIKKYIVGYLIRHPVVVIKFTYGVVSVGYDIARDEVNGLVWAYRVGRTTEDANTKFDKLISNRDLLKSKIQAIDKTTEKVNDDVFEWLIEMEEIIEKWTTDREAERETITSYREFRRLRVELLMAYKVFDEMLKRIEAINIKCEAEQFSSPIPGLEYFSSGNFECFESIKVASNRILEALLDDELFVVGLYGKCGSGKTKLVKALGEKVKYSRLFDVVLFFTVLQNPNFRQIQDEVAECLNLQFDRNTDAERRRKIYSGLASTSFSILVIFDDVREKFDPEDVGIPCDNSRCKILLATRECDLMDCQVEIPLGPLSEEEAWTLFKRHSGIDDDESSLDSLVNVARKVANKCEGLPGKIKDVGSSLKSKPIEEWKASLDSLRHSMAQWHVFLSFRGEDTRDSFTGSLYRALCQRGLNTFMDDVELTTGYQISPALTSAIEASRLSIVVLSENYASSSWCLDELVKILECMRLKSQLVWPIFYKVKPSEVRHQKDNYGTAMARHENRFGNDSEKVKNWRSALFQVANLSGFCYTSGYEYDFIQMILEKIENIKTRLYIQSIDTD